MVLVVDSTDWAKR